VLSKVRHANLGQQRVVVNLDSISRTAIVRVLGRYHAPVIKKEVLQISRKNYFEIYFSLGFLVTQAIHN